MKTLFKLINLFVLALLLSTFSCSNDDDTQVVINLQDLEVTIDENPSDEQVIGTVQNDGNSSLTYSISTQTPSGALIINASTGELTVANPELFDFETNTIITATVSADEAVNTSTVTININNVIETNAQDFTASVDENPTNGDSLGTILASGDNTLSFSISSQTPAGAVAINSSTGELTVAEATLFDFETNPAITANIAVDNSGNIETVMATISLNNVDNIALLLSTSLSNYNAASIGDWIIVTETEYDNLANNLNNITRAGTTVAEYSNTYSSQTTGALIFSNYTNTALIPNNGYVIAFKYKVYIATNKTGVKIKQSSTANNTGFSDLGNALPSHSGSSQDIFFVLKGNNTPVTANGYLGFDQPGGSMFLYNITSGNGAYWASSNASSLNGQFANQQVFYQGLSTTQMQW
ncbi:cadherin repeat domain-containing protein [Algibacter sp.]|uniref:cadherin repeat domain-containing protein n=1 Tax=Algibacter sp. TaxID=1872428 RepID=UPI003C74005F